MLLFAESPLPVILDCALQSARAMREVLGSLERQTSKSSSRRTRTKIGRITGWSSYLRPWEGDGTCPPAAVSRHLKEKKGIAVGEGKEGHVVHRDFARPLTWSPVVAL